MKKILLSFFAVLFLGMLINCASTKNQNNQTATRDYKIQREWMLVAFGNYAKSDLVKNKAKIDLTANIEEGKIKGEAYMGCNKMFFSSEFKNDGKVKISGVGSTMMACQDMKLEDDFSKSFKNMTKYSVEGHFLTLSDDQGNQMKFVAADWD
ncbi:META domain-containing protein [Chryseobacterium sp. MMS23-Vi53]|uniref:META domain-containing protein n=1 Tax=Chryseobacterium sp. MMS23-Vi53 TaxID=3386644 RepID=UPI0039EC025F